LVLLIFCGAVWLLYAQLTAKDFQQIGDRLRDIVTNSPAKLFLAIGLTVVNYVILIGYDLLAVRYVGVKLPLRRVALASFTAYTCGYNFGSTLAGTSVRYRLYSAWGVPTIKILQLLVILALTFWFGLLALAGVVFIIAPLQMPAALHLPFDTTRPLGMILLAAALVYVGLSALHFGSIKLWHWRLPVPPFKLTLYQIAIASADLLLVASVLYTLWPATEPPSGYLTVLGIYMLVFVAGVLTHVPGGYGVMELVLTTIVLDKAALPGVLASWLLFRVIYYIIPLLVAALLLGWYELRLFRRSPAVHSRPPLPEPGGNGSSTAERTSHPATRQA
jgi:uncharacterized membrane protein YbhN (UPF0104 family)